MGHLLLLLSYCAERRLTLEYRSKFIHILNPTVREDIVHPLTAVTNCQICVRLKKQQNELSREAVCSKLLIHACQLISVFSSCGAGRRHVCTYSTFMSSVAFVYSFFQHYIQPVVVLL